jgi:hypothetical protein
LVAIKEFVLGLIVLVDLVLQLLQLPLLALAVVLGELVGVLKFLHQLSPLLLVLADVVVVLLVDLLGGQVLLLRSPHTEPCIGGDGLRFGDAPSASFLLTQTVSLVALSIFRGMLLILLAFSGIAALI